MHLLQLFQIVRCFDILCYFNENKIEVKFVFLFFKSEILVFSPVFTLCNIKSIPINSTMTHFDHQVSLSLHVSPPTSLVSGDLIHEEDTQHTNKRSSENVFMYQHVYYEVNVEMTCGPIINYVKHVDFMDNVEQINMILLCTMQEPF